MSSTSLWHPLKSQVKLLDTLKYTNKYMKHSRALFGVLSKLARYPGHCSNGLEKSCLYQTLTKKPHIFVMNTFRINKISNAFHVEFPPVWGLPIGSCRERNIILMISSIFVNKSHVHKNIFYTIPKERGFLHINITYLLLWR